jgi:hypothetical protein
MRDTTGNMPPLPGIFPDYLAPIVRNAPSGERLDGGVRLVVDLDQWFEGLTGASSPLLGGEGSGEGYPIFQIY